HSPRFGFNAFEIAGRQSLLRGETRRSPGFSEQRVVDIASDQNRRKVPGRFFLDAGHAAPPVRDKRVRGRDRAALETKPKRLKRADTQVMRRASANPEHDDVGPAAGSGKQ